MTSRYLRLILAFILFILPLKYIYAESVTVTWDANSESDLQGYKVYYGLASKNYDHVIDVGNVTSTTVDNLSENVTYYFAVTAYDTANNESNYSEEAFITLTNGADQPTTPPSITDVVQINLQTIRVYFSQKMDKLSIIDPANYHISPAIQIVTIEADTSLMFVTITTSTHQIETDYHLTIENVKNESGVPLAQSYSKNYRYPDTMPPFVTGIELIDASTVKVAFNEEMDSLSVVNKANFTITPSIEIHNIDLSSDKMQVTLHTDSHSSSTSYKLTVKNVKDKRNNVLPDPFSISYSYLDHSPPTVVDIQVENNTTLVVYFSEKMDFSSITDKTHYDIQPDITIYDILADSSLKRITLRTAEHHVMVNYNLTISEVKDFSQVEIAEPYLYSYKFSDNKPPYVEKLELVSRSCLKIFFSEAMDSVDIVTLDNYKITPEVPLNNIQVDSACKVATLNTAQHSYLTQYQLSFNEIHDQANNPIPANYSLVYEFQRPASVSNISNSDYQADVLFEGDEYYIDRDYTIYQIPEEMRELTWIKTANDDKFISGDSFLSFNVQEDVMVTIGYDTRNPSIPAWLASWTASEKVIKNNRNINYLCYTKSFPAGEVTLGGNAGVDQSNMYVVLVKNLNSGKVEYPHEPGDATGTNTANNFLLKQNYPNPFNPITEIPFYLMEEDRITLTIYNLLGQRVRKFEIEVTEPGNHSFIWDGTLTNGIPAGSGIYIYTLKSSKGQETRKMTLLR